jgi:competence protein ComEC
MGPDRDRTSRRKSSQNICGRGIKRLDVVALAHAHHDDLDGLHSVLANLKVGELWIGKDEETVAFLGLLLEARARGIPIVWKMEGRDFDWDAVTGQVLWPPMCRRCPTTIRW